MGDVVLDDGVVRGAPLPGWVRVAPLPAPKGPTLRAATALLHADTQLRAGTPSATFFHRAERVNDSAALSAIGHVTIAFNPRCQRLLLHRVAIQRDDGTRVDHTASVELRCLQREAGLEQGVVSGVVTATLLLPDVRVGDTLDLAYTIEGENPIFGGRYAGWAGWDQGQPVQQREVTLVLPPGRHVQWRWLGDVPGARPEPRWLADERDGTRRLHFSGGPLAPVPFEPHLPRDAHPLQWLQFSEHRSWNEVARWACTLFPEPGALPASLQPLLAQWRALPSRAEQASQALQWVQREVRYHSAALGEGSHRPASPDEVVTRRYGDCKDKSRLLVQLLQALGMPARPALVSASTRSAPLKLLPSPEAFDHVIVQLRLDGVEHWLDATRAPQPAALGVLGQGLEGAAALVVSPDTEALSLIRSPNPAHAFGHVVHDRYVVEQRDGSARLLSEQHWHGLGAESLHAMLVRMDEQALSAWASERFARQHDDVALEGVPELQHDLQRNRLTVRTRLRLPHAVQWEDEWHGRLRWSAPALSAAFVMPERNVQRRLALLVPGFPGELRHTLEVHGPEGLTPHAVETPAAFTTPRLRLQVEQQAEGGNWRRSASLRPLVANVPAAEMAALAEDLRRLDTLLHGELVLRPAADPLQPWRRQAEQAGRAIARGHLVGEDLAQAHLLRGQARLALQRCGDALADADHAIVQAPGLHEAWRLRGEALQALERPAEAAEAFGRALCLDGPAQALYRQRAQVRQQAGDRERAERDLEQAKALDAGPSRGPA